jgi:hypothetical protein
MCLGASAQNLRITGTVSDQNGQPILAATVAVVGTTSATITDINGVYEIQAAKDATLEFSYVGMATQTLQVAGRTKIDVVLQEDAQQIEELVVVGYGSGVEAKSLVGSAPDNIRYYVELRGVGIVNVRRMYGIGSVKNTEKINMVIQMEPWEQGKNYDRMGLDGETVDILGIAVPSITIPVSPGRNLAIIIESAAMNNRQKKMGYNAAQELLHKLGMADDSGVPDASHWDNY